MAWFNPPSPHPQDDIETLRQGNQQFVYSRRQLGVGEQRRTGISIPDGPLGIASGKCDGNVKDALFGWPKGSGHHKNTKVHFNNDSDFLTKDEVTQRDNMFDIMAHTYLAENQVEKYKSNQKAMTVKKKFPKTPRKNATYVSRNNSIAEQFFQVEQKQPWKMSKFEKGATARISTFRVEGCTGDENQDDGANRGGDPCAYYSVKCGSSPSRELHTPPEDRQVPAPVPTEQPEKDLKNLTDEQLFSI